MTERECVKMKLCAAKKVQKEMREMLEKQNERVSRLEAKLEVMSLIESER